MHKGQNDSALTMLNHPYKPYMLLAECHWSAVLNANMLTFESRRV